MGHDSGTANHGSSISNTIDQGVGVGHKPANQRASQGLTLLFLQAVTAESMASVTGRGLHTMGYKVICKQKYGRDCLPVMPGGPLHLHTSSPFNPVGSPGTWSARWANKLPLGLKLFGKSFFHLSLKTS